MSACQTLPGRRPSGDPIDLQDRFDPLPEDAGDVHALGLPDGRRARFIDEGEPSWRAVVFFGGACTSVGAFSLTEFLRTSRELLRLRVVSVERNGFGATPFDPSLGYAAAVDDVIAVLGALRIERFAVVAFSGGAPIGAALAARVPERVISLHLAAAAVARLAGRTGSAAAHFADPAAIAADPSAMWRFPAASPVHRIPGFAAAGAREGVRALDSGHAPAAIAHEWRLLRSEPPADLRGCAAPAYLYWGTGDDLVPPVHAQRWQHALVNVAALRRYEGEGHDVQYRHWDQILLDAAGHGARTLVCADGRASLVADVEPGATLGLCAWSSAAP